MRHSSDGPTTPASPLRPSRRGPRGLSLTPRRFSHRPVFARLRLPTRRRARATWLVAYSAVTLPSTGPREFSGYGPKTSEDGFIRRLVFANLRHPIRRWCPQHTPITTYTMCTIELHKGVIDNIDRARKQCLWRGNELDNVGIWLHGPWFSDQRRKEASE